MDYVDGVDEAHDAGDVGARKMDISESAVNSYTYLCCSLKKGERYVCIMGNDNE